MRRASSSAAWTTTSSAPSSSCASGSCPAGSRSDSATAADRFGRRTTVGALVITIGILAGACAPSQDAATPTTAADPERAPRPSDSATRSVPLVRLPQAEPVDRAEAAIAIAFDPATSADLAQGLPADLDWATTGVLCVYLGRRAEGGWGLTIQSASLVDGELQILARETRPTPGVDRPGPTFPADCATIDRGALPPGPLPARADDTISDEFIVSSELQVPAP